MELQSLIELLRQMISIPSTSRDEGRVCDMMEAWMREHALDKTGRQYPLRREGANLILEEEGRGDGRPVVLLNGHIDTVKPAKSYSRDPFCASLEGDILYGLGSNDDGGSVIALLAAYLDLVQRPQAFRLIFTATAEEEVCGTGGLEMILPSLGEIDLGIIGEPTGMQMAVAEKGLMVLDCTARGKSGHAAREEGVNAIYEALKDIEWFRNHRFERVSPYLGPVKMSVTMIEAGTQHNVVPDSCRFVVDVRPNGLYSNLELLGLIKESVSCEVKERSTRLNSSHIDEAHPIVQRGLSMGLKAFGSPTCSNQTLSAFTTIKIGPGESSRSHSADEFIRISEIEEGIRTYIGLLDGLRIR